MGRFSRSALTVALSLVVASAAHAQGKGTAQGFGGYSVGAPPTPVPSLGGTITLAVTPNIHVIGEAGRLGNVLPSMSRWSSGRAGRAGLGVLR